MVMLKQADGSYACIAENANRFSLGEAKEELLRVLGLQEEEGSCLEFLRRGYKSLYSYNSLRPKLIEPKGQLLSIDGKTEEEVCRSLERVLRTMRITTSEPKDVAFVVDGWALEIALTHYRKAFTELAVLSRTAILPICIESLNIADHAAFDNHTSYMGSINGPKLPLVFEVQQMPHDLTTEGCPKNNFQNSCIFNKDLWMGIVLLFIDIMVALEILVRKVHGCKASGSQRKRLNRTMTDIMVIITYLKPEDFACRRANCSHCRDLL
ncbi:hypothetical protein JHK87_010434 [Glycine soja]|nr:hypothetical protein JHK87_010434 [Glycine soja]